MSTYSSSYYKQRRAAGKLAAYEAGPHYRVSVLINNARSRCKRDGKLFSLKREHVVIPDVYPLLGIPIVWGQGKRTDNSPSLDKIDPKGGYTPDNVWVVSDRANRIKNDATPAELHHIAAALEARWTT